MKKPYIKPMITVERLMIDQPMAVGCVADFDDIKSLMDLGYFGDQETCGIVFDENKPNGYDTVCYHSNVQTAFTS